MTRDELRALLRLHGVPERYYVLDGSLGAGECYGLARDRDGWVVYYSERGRRNVLDRVAAEDAACRLMLGYINESMRHRFGRAIPLPEQT
jgi:hypothetical protein